jgi:hypothetical protein
MPFKVVRLNNVILWAAASCGMLKHNRAYSSTRHNSTGVDPIQAAIDDIESLRPGEQFSYTQMAKKYGVIRSRLTRRHQR